MTTGNTQPHGASPEALRASPLMEKLGMKFAQGGSHISRTIMLAELEATLAAVPQASSSLDYRTAIIDRNVLGKTTVSTRLKSLRHLRELYALDEATPIFGLLRKLHSIDPASLPQLAMLTAWARDPLLRATAPPVLDAIDGDILGPADLAAAVETAFPNHYSELNRNKIARNAASSWTQSGHLAGRTKKSRQRLKPSIAAVSMALFLGDAAGYHGAAVFASPWCRLLDLNPESARAHCLKAHRAGLVNLRAIGEVVELGFPLFTEFQISQT